MSTEAAGTPAQADCCRLCRRRPGAGIGHSRRRRRGRPDRPDPHPAGHHQPARSGRRSDRNRQDQDAAAHRRAAQRGRGSGADGRREGRPVRAVPAGGGQRQDRGARQGHRRQLDGHGIPGGVPVAGHRRNRGAGARHHRQLRPGPVVKSAGAQRHSGVDAGADLPLGERQQASAGHPERSARRHHPPDQRRGQGRPEIPGRSVVRRRRASSCERW